MERRSVYVFAHSVNDGVICELIGELCGAIALERVGLLLSPRRSGGAFMLPTPE
jgi:hypothetical protein